MEVLVGIESKQLVLLDRRREEEVDVPRGDQL
jgi:hypothetical protein